MTDGLAQMMGTVMMGAVNRLTELERAIRVHRELMQENVLDPAAINSALWAIYESQGGCNGGCCG